MTDSCYTPGILSCEPRWSVRVVTQGGRKTITDLSDQLLSGTMSRTLDGTSTAGVEVNIETRGGALCCAAIQDVQGGWGCMELEIARDAGICWAGPITLTQYQYGKLTLSAEDLTAWWRRRTNGNLSWTNVDVATIFKDVHDDAMLEEPVVGFKIAPTATGVLASRVILATDDKYASETIDELARTAIDYTAVARTVYVGGGTIPALPIVNLTDDMWTGNGPTVEWAGDLYASRVIVHGANGLRAVAEQPEGERTCGLVTRVFHEDTILDQTSLQAAADNRLSVLKNPWRVTPQDGDEIQCGSPIDFARLIPGARVRVLTDVACSKIQADFRLVGISADLTKNTVGVTLAPLGIGGFVAGNTGDEGSD